MCLHLRSVKCASIDYRKVALYSHAAKWQITPYYDKKINFDFSHLHCLTTLRRLVAVAKERVH